MAVEQGELIKQIQREDYWFLSKAYRDTLWVDLISQNVGIPTKEAAARIAAVRSQPFSETEEVWYKNQFRGDGSFSYHFFRSAVEVYSGLNAAGSLLTLASPNHEGPRGLRPSLVSLSNILKLHCLDNQQAEAYKKRFRSAFRSVGDFLLDRMLTASNPLGRRADFSEEDIRKGVHIPSPLDPPATAALGIIYGRGTLDQNHLIFSFGKRDGEFFRKSVRQTFSEAFNFPEDKEVAESDGTNIFSRKESVLWTLKYTSSALGNLLRRIKQEGGLSTFIMDTEPELQDSFLQYYLGASASFSKHQGEALNLFSKSLPLLEDVKKLLQKRVAFDLPKPHPTSWSPDSHVLEVSKIPTGELFFQGYLDVNSRIREAAERYWHTKQNMSSRILRHLERHHPDLILGEQQLLSA